LVAQESGELERALSLARASRASNFPEDLRTKLDVLAWEVATELGRAVDIRDESLYLLLNSPIDAFELDVEELIVGSDGEIDWNEYYEPAELLHRASLLIDSDLRDEAFAVLDALSEGERDLDWRLLKARALIEDRRGVEALELLGEAKALDISSRLDIDWLRAMAAFDAATARQGRQNLPSSQRSEMRSHGRAHLRAIVNRGGDSAQAVQALERLFEELADGEHFEEVLTILTRLKAVDPGDYSGARYLFGLGWNQYERRNYSGAIGYWRELIELYPDSKRARAGRYWSARAHESLANQPRARTLYEQVTSAATTDYYSKYALARLGREEEARTASLGNIEPWPRDPSLSRAELLSDAGLDALGLEEAQLLDDVAERRASLALKARILARQGRRRDSIQHLWRAFPSLGSSEQSEVPQEALRMYYPLDFHDIVKQSARDAGIPPTLLFAMIRQESAFDVSARSWAGARGLMQVMPATARELAQRLGLPYSVDRLSDPAYSVKLGSSYFRQVLDMFDGEIELALAGYNAGPYRIRKLVRNAGSTIELDRFMEGLPIEESKTYVRRVVLFSNSYASLYPELG
jgi:soluble lytic murein transglycosylase